MPDVTITFTRDEVVRVMTALAQKATGCEGIKPRIDFRAEGGNVSPFARVTVVFEGGRNLNQMLPGGEANEVLSPALIHATNQAEA